MLTLLDEGGNPSASLCSSNVSEFNCEGTGILYYEDLLFWFFFSCYIISIFNVSFLILHGISFSDSFVNTVRQYKATGNLCRNYFHSICVSESLDSFKCKTPNFYFVKIMISLRLTLVGCTA